MATAPASRVARLLAGACLLLPLLAATPSGRAQAPTTYRIGEDAGSVTTLGPDGFDITARGRGTAIGNDQLMLAATERAGDFDLQVRVDAVSVSNPYVRAGLMARASADANAPFAAVFASSPVAGCFLESRSGPGGNPGRLSIPGGFPSSPPGTWLRLRRTGSQLSGFASTDGSNWTLLGTVTASLPDRVLVGPAVASQNPDIATTARLRGLADTTSTAEAPFLHPGESPTPSSRRTGLVISEIQYHPRPGTNGTDGLEFVEIANHGNIFQELTGWSLAGAVDFRFPDGFRLEVGDHVVVAGNPQALQAATGLPIVLGPWSGSLDNAGESLELRDAIGAIKLQVAWSPDAPWPAAAAGTGHSLVLSAPSHGEAEPQAWSASHHRGGSPGRRDPASDHPAGPVVINEFLAHTDLPQLDFIELYNRSATEVDLSGWILTDNPGQPRFRIPDGTRLPAGGFAAWDETELGFRLAASGETVFLITPDQRRVADAVRFGPQENGVSTGRLPNGSDTFRRLDQPSPGATNLRRRPEDLVVNEIFFNPPGGDADEFLELYHRGTTPVSLDGWRLRGGIDFDFPPGLTVQPGQYLVVAKDRDRLLSNHPGLPAAAVVGGYSGQLGNGGDLVRLTRPDTLLGTNDLGEQTVDTIHIPVAEVRYVDGGTWGRWSDGGGSSLELVDPDADPALGANWADSDETAKGEWTRVEWTGRLDNGNAANGLNRLFLGLLNDGECQVDDIEVIRAGGTNLLQNPGFESGQTGWLLSGNHAASTLNADAARSGNIGLHLRAEGGLDTGINSVRGTLALGLAAGQQVTLRASVRWLRGWPELLFRVRGNFADFAAPLAVPRNLGTPGRPNSRRIDNAGPAIHTVRQSPALPAAGQPVRVVVSADDPDGIANLRLRYRLDPSATTSELPLRDDGLDGDEVAGDGRHTAVIPGQSTATLVAYTVRADDGAGGISVWPAQAPVDEGLIRWGDPVPFGSIPHVHLWTTSVNRRAPGGNALNNAYRRATLVYGNTRVIHGVRYRDKGSPYHNGSGDLTALAPKDDLLHGVTERVFGRTGNGGNEETGLRTRVANWIAAEMGIPSLNGNYQRLYMNGATFANISEDLEEPDHRYAQHHGPDGDEGDLYKISIWFEFADNNSGFNPTQATLQRFVSDGELKLARYRWNWERRARRFPESDYRTVFDLVETLNSPNDATFAQRVLQQADIAQWMGVFAFHRVTGNWDSWTYNVGQNMYLYRQPGRPAVLFPWDIDFVLGLGDGPTAGLWGGQDPIANSRLYDQPAFRRMLWRALSRAAEGPMLSGRFQPVIDAHRAIQLQNGIPGLASTTGITSYLNSRRSNILSRRNAADVAALAITTNNGNPVTSPTPAITLTGTAPFRVADLEVNGVRYPVTWTSFTAFSLTVPLTAATNDLRVVGLDESGEPLGDADTIRVFFPGALPQARDWVVLNEIHYNPAEPGTGFVEIHNRHPSVPFHLGGYRLDGVGYTFPDTAVIPANGFLVLASDRAAFATLYGAAIPVFDAFPGRLDNDGERLRLLAPDDDRPVGEVRYHDDAPWPVLADGQGPSLQLIDPAQDTRRPANWMATATNAPGRTTPGAANSLRATLAAFPTVWINEVFPEAPDGAPDNAGDAEPFLELHNPGTTAADLAGLWLSDRLDTPERWAFPPGTTVPAGGFLRVWLDGEESESAPGHLHAGFRPAAGTGLLVLTRRQGNPSAPAVLDWIEYHGLPPGRGFGSIPDGEPHARRPLYRATPGAANDPFVPTVEVVLNEFLAQNTAVNIDPADGDHDDWIELYNPGAEPADLSGYFLTDNLADRTASMLPPGTIIPAGGHLLVWADNEPGQTDVASGRIHVGFSLSRDGESIGLFAPDGSLVDAHTFGPQEANRSVGRFPDGPDGDWIPLDAPTPGEANFIPGGNIPPRFTLVPLQTIPEEVRWSLRLEATDADAGQTLRFSLGDNPPVGVELDPETGDLSWTPDELQGPGRYDILVRVTDSGEPPRSASTRVPVQVNEANRPPVLAGIPPSTVGEGELLTRNLAGTDPDRPAQTLTFGLGPDAPAGLAVDPTTGVLTWVPAEEHGPGTFDVTITLTDSGSPPATATAVVRIHVEERDNPPVIAQPDAQSIDEGSAYSLQLRGFDPDGAPVRYAFQSEPPAGLSLDPVTGVLSWLPTEDQGPGSYPVIVQVTEQSPLAQTAQATFSILVREVNQRPTLAPLPALDRVEGDTIEWTVTASDTDRPAQELFFAIEGNVPGSASIDPRSGHLVWNLPDDLGAADLELVVRVTDDAETPLSDTRPFRVRVRPRFNVVISEILPRPATPGGEYLELHNPSAATAWDLTGLQLVGDAFSFTFPEGTVLPPLGQVCVAARADVFRSAYGTAPPLAGTWTGTLGATGDDLRLRAPGGEVLDRVRFATAAPWPVVPAGSGIALQLIDPRADNSRAGNWSASTTYNGPRQLATLTGPWRHLQTGPAPAGWTAPGFDDRGWPSGNGLFFVESADLPAAKSTPLTLGQSAYYFRSTFVLPTVPAGASLSLGHVLDDGAVFHLNGTELTRVSMPDGPITHATLASATVGDAAFVGPIALPAQALVAGTNVLAVEVHQASAGSSDIVFGAVLDLVGGTVASRTPGEPNSVAAPMSPFPDVRLNELQSVAGTLRDRLGEAEPWVELLNHGDETVSLNGWTLSGSGAITAWTFPNGASLAPGQRRIVFLDAEPAESTSTEWHAHFRPLASGGRLALSRPDPVGSGVVDSLTYPAAIPGRSWSAAPEGQSFSHAWLVPTPGAANPPPIVSNPVLTGTWTGTGLRLGWDTVDGVTYRIDAATVLTPGAWQSVERVVGTGTRVEVEDPLPPDDARFYRVVIE